MDYKTITLIILIPIISAFIGWITNYIAIRSLFRPIKPIKILGITFYGLIPKRQKTISKNIASIVEEYFFSHNDILKELEKPQNLQKIKTKLIPILSKRILEKVPSMFQTIAEPIINNVLEKEIDKIIVDIKNELGNFIYENINIKSIIEQKLEKINTLELERITYKVAKTELKHIELLGALIGFIVGLLQLCLMLII